jgi:REP element-mobilizing transposase RayT
MPRSLRHPSPSGFFHVTSRALRPLRLFEDEDDCAAFDHALARAHRLDGLEIHAYCLMGTHFHLVVRSAPDVLSCAMRRLKGWYAYTLNAKRGRRGPVFDRRYSAGAVATEAHAYATVVYVALNPVRAGLVEHPDEWPYGSHRAHAGLDARPVWLAAPSELAGWSSERAYRAAIDEAVDEVRRRRRQGWLDDG